MDNVTIAFVHCSHFVHHRPKNSFHECFKSIAVSIDVPPELFHLIFHYLCRGRLEVVLADSASTTPVEKFLGLAYSRNIDICN